MPNEDIHKQLADQQPVDLLPRQAVANSFCVVHGKQGEAGFFIEGPFASQEDAQTNADDDQQRYPDIPVSVEGLINPANC